MATPRFQTVESTSPVVGQVATWNGAMWEAQDLISGTTFDLVTIGNHAINIPAAGQTYRLTFDYSAAGEFAHPNFMALVTCDSTDVVIQPETNLQRVDRLSILVFVKESESDSYSYGFDVVLNGSILGTGWTGETTELTGTWSTLEEVN